MRQGHVVAAFESLLAIHGAFYPQMNFPLMLMSFGVGILIGLTSMGGAALMAPFLIMVVGVKPVTAVGTDLVYSAVTKIAGAWVHFKAGYRGPAGGPKARHGQHSRRAGWSVAGDCASPVHA